VDRRRLIGTRPSLGDRRAVGSVTLSSVRLAARGIDERDAPSLGEVGTQRARGWRHRVVDVEPMAAQIVTQNLVA